MNQKFGKLVIFGVGLIGGSCALALKERHAVEEVVGIGRTQKNLDEALRLNVIDRAATLASDWENEVADADLILIATPVTQTRALLNRILPAVSVDAILTDAGSTKQDVIAAAEAAYANNPRVSFARFVPAHPIAGTEHSGAAAAFATLYQNKNVVLTPLAQTDPDCFERVKDLWTTCGAVLHQMTPAAHDRIFAAVSHLPHVLAFTLVAELAQRSDADLFFRYAGSGFRDFTRIAASSPEMWRDIACANHSALTNEIDAFIALLREIREDVATQNAPAIEARFKVASEGRRQMTEDR